MLKAGIFHQVSHGHTLTLTLKQGSSRTDDRCLTKAKRMDVYITEGVLINQAPIPYLQFEAQSRMDGNKSIFYLSTLLKSTSL